MTDTITDDLPSIRTKIVATVGPASRAPAVLRRLMEAGVSAFRLNFSHGTHEEHSTVLADIRAISREMGRHVAVLQDLCGPKMRLGPIPGDLVECPRGEEFTLVAERSSDSARELTCSYHGLPNDLKPGETVLFADGTVAMTVTDVAAGRARLQVTLPGRLRSRQGLNLPGSQLAVKSLTDKDLHDLDWTARARRRRPVRGALVRAQPGRCRVAAPGAAGAEVPGSDRGQDREAAGGAAPGGDCRRDRLRHGRPRRPRRRDGRATGAGHPEAGNWAVQSRPIAR